MGYFQSFRFLLNSASFFKAHITPTKNAESCSNTVLHKSTAADVHTKVIKSYVCCTCIFMSFLFCIRWDPSDELTLVKKRLHVCPTSFSKGGSQQHMVRSLRCHLNFKLSPWIKSLLFLSPWALHRILNLFLSPTNRCLALTCCVLWFTTQLLVIQASTTCACAFFFFCCQI